MKIVQLNDSFFKKSIRPPDFPMNKIIQDSVTVPDGSPWPHNKPLG